MAAGQGKPIEWPKYPIRPARYVQMMRELGKSDREIELMLMGPIGRPCKERNSTDE